MFKFIFAMFLTAGLYYFHASPTTCIIVSICFRSFLTPDAADAQSNSDSQSKKTDLT